MAFVFSLGIDIHSPFTAKKGEALTAVHFVTRPSAEREISIKSSACNRQFRD